MNVFVNGGGWLLLSHSQIARYWEKIKSNKMSLRGIFVNEWSFYELHKIKISLKVGDNFLMTNFNLNLNLLKT